MTPDGPVNLVRPDFPWQKTGRHSGEPQPDPTKEKAVRSEPSPGKDRRSPRFEPDTFTVKGDVLLRTILNCHTAILRLAFRRIVVGNRLGRTDPLNDHALTVDIVFFDQIILYAFGASFR